MSNSSPTLNDLILLNREIAALVRAGIPLELGLRGFGGSVATRLSRLSERIAERMSEGLSLPQALAEEGPAISPVYTAVVEAGIAAGQLPRALESLAESGELIQETRNRVSLALFYPAICVIVGYAGICGFFIAVVPRLAMVKDMLPKSWPLETLEAISVHHRYLTMVIPSIVFAICVLIVLLRNSLTRGIWRQLVSFRWVLGPSLDWAQFCELLALQLEHRAALPAAFRLAADATDNSRWRREAHAIAEKLNRGVSLKESLDSSRWLPPLTRWMLAAAEKQGTLIETLRQLSGTYRRRAIRRAAILKVWLPVVLTAVLTATIALTYGLAFFIPLRIFLSGLASE